MNQALQKPSRVLARKTLFFWAILFLTGVLVGGGFIYHAKTKPARLAREAEATFAKARRTIDPEELRKWALEAISNCLTTNQSKVITSVEQSEIPKAITTLTSTPFHAVVEQPMEGREPFVSIMWDADSLGCNWWLTIGSKNFVAFSNSTVQYGYYQTGVWAPGIYFNCRHRQTPL